MSYLNNPWVIGISGGMLSGIFVAYISRTILSKKDNREYLQKIKIANNEILYAIRPCITEEITPSISVIESLIKATSRKYSISSNDIYDVYEIIQELTKEVMDSSFISSKIKEEYCGRLQLLINKPELSDIQKEISIQEFDRSSIEKIERLSISEYKSGNIKMLSVVFGLITAMMTLVFIIWGDINISADEFSRASKFLLPSLIVISAIILSLYTSIFYKKSKKKLDDIKEKNIKIKE